MLHPRVELMRTRLHEAVLGLALLAFAAFKWGSLDLPYYWDEAWVYAPAASALLENGISLLPDAITPELSRGHPLLFHATAATWMSVLGNSRENAHLFAMFIAMLLCIATFRLGCVTGNKSVGLVSAFLLLVNETFLAQSGLLLPEILLALFSVVAILGHLSRNALLFSLAGTGALLTKESAIVLILALLAAQAIFLFTATDHQARAKELRWTGVLVIPLLPVLAFFMLQKATLGWYLYPEHLGLITWTVKEVAYKAKLVFTTAFERQGVFTLTYAFAFIGTLLSTRLPIWLRVLTAFLFVAAIKVLFGRWELPGPLTLIAPLLCFAIFAFTFLRSLIQLQPKTGQLIACCFMLCIGLWGFTSLNFYTGRYLMPMIPAIAVGSIAMMHVALERWHAQGASALGLALAIFIGSQIGHNAQIGDCQLAYRDAINVHLERIAFCEDKDLHEEVIYCSFMDIYYMTQPAAGYLGSARTFSRTFNRIGPETRFSFVGYDSALELRPALIAQGFRPIARFDHGRAWAEVLERP